MSDKNSKFGFGLLLGLVTGAVAGIFLNPKTGKENREMASKALNYWKNAWEKGEVDDRIKDMFGDVTDQSKQMYEDVQEKMMSHMDDLKGALGSIDKEKYMTVVEHIVESLKDEKKFPMDQVQKVLKYLQKDYQMVANQAKEEKEEAEKETKEHVEKTKEKAKKLLAEK